MATSYGVPTWDINDVLNSCMRHKYGFLNAFYRHLYGLKIDLGK